MYPEETSVHRVRFFTPDNLKGIHCMCIDEESGKVAVGRRGLDEETSGSSLIEIWNMEHSPCIEQKLYEDDDEPVLIESICWGSNGRLFSSGCDGNVNEYDLVKGCIKHRNDISGGPVWCLAIDAGCTKLISGSEDGSISTIAITEEGFGEVGRIGKMSHRVLSLVWMQIGEKIVAGSEGMIAIYDSKLKTQVEKIELDKDTLVWSLAVFKDTIISGDSKGYTSFWDGGQGVLRKRHHSHQSAVLTVSVSKKGVVFSSGIDPLIAQFDAISTKPLPPIHAHTHDITSIVLDHSGSLFSGGKDVLLVRTSFSPKQITKFSPDLSDSIKLWQNLLSLQYSKTIELYSLDTKIVSNTNTRGVSNTSPRIVSDTNARVVPERSESPLPTKLMRIRSKCNIITSAMNAKWIVYSGFKEIVFIDLEGEEVSKVRHSLSFGDEVTVNRMSFLDNWTLAVCTSTKIHVISLTDGRVSELASKQFDHRIVSLSSCPQSIAVILSNKELIYLPKGKWTPVSVSKVASIPTAMGFNPFEWKKLFVCTSNKTLVEFNLEQHELREEKSTNLTQLERDHYFRGMAFKPESILIFTDTQLCSLHISSFSFKARVSHYNSILSIHSIPSLPSSLLPPQIVLVELPQQHFIRLLPPPFFKRIFGAE